MRLWKDKRTLKMRSEFGLFFCVLLSAGIAIAATCVLSKPWDAPITDNYHIRDKHPVSGASNRPHRGTDLSKPGDSDCGETIALREGCTTETYTQYGGYGNTLIRDCGDGVKELYGHLQSYNTPPGTVQVGSTGGSTGCHLHYEVIIDGVTVDPECVWGTGADCPAQLGQGGTSQANLCDAAQRDLLKQNAQSKLGSAANSPVVEGGNAVGGSTPTTGSGPGGSDPGANGGGGGGGGGTYNGPDTDTDDPITTGNTGGGGGGDTTPDDDEPPPLPPAPTDGSSDTLPPPPSGGDGEVSGCAPDTWNAMTNQATMEARREVVMNQTFIVKPDSILQYACFEKALNGVQDKAGPIFSESDYWKDREVDISGKSAENPKEKKITVNKSLGSASLDMSIASVVKTAMSSYLQDNFNHKMLGGTSDIAADGTCGLMKKVWDASKCRNFDGEKIFYTFDELVGNDPRQYPDTMKCTDTGITQEMIDIAHNKDFAHAKTTKAKSYATYLLGKKGCNLPIKTGVTVHRRQVDGDTAETKKYPDAVCPNAGCSYVNNGNEEGQCQ